MRTTGVLTSTICLFQAASVSALGIRRQNATSVPYYPLEEHWVSPSLKHYVDANPVAEVLGLSALDSKLSNLSSGRIENMDANNIAVEIVSHVPFPEADYSLNLSMIANNELANATSLYPSRFRAFCLLPMALPNAAAHELRRCVKELGGVGALVDAALSNGEFYDDPAYDVLWSALEELDVPIYLHPAWPKWDDIAQDGYGLYAPTQQGNYPIKDAASIATGVWGWHIKTGTGFLKLYLAGVFERHPNLKILLGHMGELLPYFLARQERLLGNRTQTITEVYAKHVYVTTSGMFSLDPMTTLLRTTNHSRILFSIDYPFETNENGASFMANLSKSGLVTEEEFAGIAYGNAKNLLKL